MLFMKALFNTRHQLHLPFVLLVAACYVTCVEAADCNRLFGPAGTSHCVKFPEYDNYQWTVCRTNTYIQTTSKGRHRCKDRTRIYCHYQCMLDLSNKEDGTVLPHCLCSPFGPPPTEKIKLPSWCYSPNGTECNWYKECLNKAYPSCENDDDDYTIKYSEKFCQLYNQRDGKLSSQAKKWINAARKCLQVKLVPMIDKTFNKSCAKLKSRAFKINRPCYLNPDESSKYCDLPLSNKWSIFWTIKSAFYQVYLPSLEYLLNAYGQCIQKGSYREREETKEIKSRIEEKVSDSAVDRVGLNATTAHIRETNERINAWIDSLKKPTPPVELFLFLQKDDEETERSDFFRDVIDAIALQQSWKNKGVVWFARGRTVHAVNGITSWSTRLLVADRYTYEIQDAFNSRSFPTQPANISAILMNLSKAALNGDLKFTIKGERVKITKIHGCIDWNCQEKAFKITAPNAAVLRNAIGIFSFAFLIISSSFIIT